ncbi:hypothetical protein LXA43DRAFT_1024307 [Ganoderma leucocontextum]|nr:hypothetical protein LXA43DRAFT_1024307 [Ganoderma leucocontextum]
MPSTPSPAAIQEVLAHILKCSQNMDAMATDAMTSLQFSDVPARWPDEAKVVLADLARSARQAAAQQIRDTGKSIRGSRTLPSTELTEQLTQVHRKETTLTTFLPALTAMTASDLVGPVPECRDAIRSCLPQLTEKVAAFAQDLPQLRASLRDIMPMYVILESPRLDLEATLDALFPTDLHEDPINTGVAAVQQLLTLMNERRTLLERAAGLQSFLETRFVPADKMGHAWDELCGLVGPLANQVLSQRVYLDTIADTVRSVQNEFPVLRNVLRDKNVTVQDLLAARDKHRLLVEALNAISQVGDLHINLHTIRCLLTCPSIKARESTR